MPYRGKPSAGCATCRRRKIKCDLRPGGCEKCEKSGWKCEGYRDVGSLMFHDESENIKTKVKVSQQRKRAEKVSPKRASPETASSAIVPQTVTQKVDSLASQWSDSTDSDSNSSESSPPPILSLSPTLDDLALGWFFDKYVFKNKSERQLWDIDDGNGCLYSSVLALGLAGATRQTGPGHIITHPAARKHYLAAIQQTNQALRSPEEVTKDSTLQAINILAIFEILGGYERSLDAWRDHIRGAASLLQLRGSDQFKTHTGCRLFMQTTANMVIASLARRLPLPDHVIAMQEIAEKHVPNPQDSMWRFHCNSLRMVGLNARLLPGNRVQCPLQAQDIIVEAFEIFREFSNIIDTAPCDWRPIVVSDSGPVIYADYYYVFTTSLITQVFCANCAYRILLIDIMNQALQAGSTCPDFHLQPDQREQIIEAIGSVKELQLAILATIPQHFGPRFQTPEPQSPDSPSVPDPLWNNFNSKDYIPFRGAKKRSRDLPFVRMSGGYLMQFPLFTAGAADRPGGPIRNWSTGMLKVLGETMGIQQAFVLADQLKVARDKGLMP